MAGDRPSLPGIEVLVVAYGAPALLRRCLTTLGGAYPVTVVDNSSDPAVLGEAEAAGAAYVDPGRNLGFAAGVNRGLALLPPGRDVLLLNPDAAVGAADVAALQRCLHREPDLACVAPSQTDDAGRPARVAWPFPSPAGAWIEAVGLGGLRRREDFVIGSVLLLRAEALARVGPFDERFFLYTEETDWQRRAVDLGWRSAVCPDVRAVHQGAGTGGDERRREARFHASHERYLRKHAGGTGWQIYRAGTLVGAGLRACVLPGDRGRRAAWRFRLYRQGPVEADARLAAGDGTAAGDGSAAGVERPLRIVHVVCTDNFAGVERYICDVARELRCRGHDVTVVGGAADRMATELPEGVRWRPGSTVAAAARALAGVPPVDVVHAHMTAAETAAWLARPFHRAPVVATRHFAAGRGSSAAARAVGRIATRSVRREVAISRFVADTVAEPTVLIPNGVVDRPSAPLTSHRALMLQRLDPEKAPEVGLEAWAASGLGSRGWTLVVAGTGTLDGELPAVAARLGVEASVSFAGAVADTDGLLAGSSLFLAPAPAEPFGLAVVEAMARGLPVVAAGGGGHLETVADAGTLFPPGDATAAGRALARLADDPDRRRAEGSALRDRQRAHFTVPGHVDALERLYREVVAEAPGAGSAKASASR